MRRVDLTNWIMHFVHPLRDEFVPGDLPDGKSLTQIFHEDPSLNERFSFFEIFEYEKQLYDDSAVGILQRILEMGFIKTGWSWRAGRATIYGPKSAACFTEMPLYALLEYSKSRAKSGAVAPFGIGLLRDEFFRAGGRSVIYGLSGHHREQKRSVWPRKLASDSGIAETEQYRYVSMSHGNRTIDWSHEREWRWCDLNDSYECPGLPIWFKTEKPLFSKVFILVETATQVDEVLNQLKEQFDARSHDYGWEYNIHLIENTLVTSLEHIRECIQTRELSTVRFEDLPTSAIRVVRKVEPSREVIESARRVIAEAEAAAIEAAENYRNTAPKNEAGLIKDVSGFAHVLSTNEHSYREEIAALVEIGEARAIGGRGYRIGNFCGKACVQSALGEHEAAARAAVKVLNSKLGPFFEVRTFWD